VFTVSDGATELFIKLLDSDGGCFTNKIVIRATTVTVVASPTKSSSVPPQ
jgi:hypothetical protein